MKQELNNLIKSVLAEKDNMTSKSLKNITGKLAHQAEIIGLDDSFALKQLQDEARRAV